jgi:hypothetical protein
MITSSKDVESASSVASDSYRALVNRVVESATFARSKRLSGLLEFICDLALSGKAAEISEQKIGEDVLAGRDFTTLQTMALSELKRAASARGSIATSTKRA